MVKPSILIADDDENIRFILEKSLGSADYELETARDGRDALDKIAHRTYDLLLLDLNMGAVSGIQVLSALRKEDRDTLVIILTAHSNFESAVEALRLGAFDYLLKPSTTEAIRKRVQEAIHSLRRRRLLSKMEQFMQTLSELDESERTDKFSSSDRFIRDGKLVIDLHHRTAVMENQSLDLTTAEFNLLVALVSAAPEPVSASQLVQEALNYSCAETEAREIVKTHIYHLRQKIENDPQKPYSVKTIRYKGYLWSGGG